MARSRASGAPPRWRSSWACRASGRSPGWRRAARARGSSRSCARWSAAHATARRSPMRSPRRRPRRARPHARRLAERRREGGAADPARRRAAAGAVGAAAGRRGAAGELRRLSAQSSTVTAWSGSSLDRPRAPDRAGAARGRAVDAGAGGGRLEAGGLGFLAAGYKTGRRGRRGCRCGPRRHGGRAVRGQRLRAAGASRPTATAVARYAARADPARRAAGRDPRRRRAATTTAARRSSRSCAPPSPAVASFTFGCPPRGDDRSAPARRGRRVGDGHDAGRGARGDGGGRGRARRAGRRGRRPPRRLRRRARQERSGCWPLLQLVRAEVELPLVATGGIMTGAGIAAVLAAGASAAQLGSALMLTPEADTSAAAPRGARARRGDGAHARLQRPHRARDRQPLPARARRGRAERLPRGPPPHRAPAQGRARARATRRRSTCGPGRPTRSRKPSRPASWSAGSPPTLAPPCGPPPTPPLRTANQTVSETL